MLLGERTKMCFARMTWCGCSQRFSAFIQLYSKRKIIILWATAYVRSSPVLSLFICLSQFIFSWQVGQMRQNRDTANFGPIPNQSNFKFQPWTHHGKLTQLTRDFLDILHKCTKFSLSSTVKYSLWRRIELGSHWSKLNLMSYCEWTWAKQNASLQRLQRTRKAQTNACNNQI